MAGKPYRQLAVIVVAVLVLGALTGILVQKTPMAGAMTVAPPEGGVGDTGKFLYESNMKLDQLNANVRETNAKLQELIDLIKSGKVEIVTKNAAKPADADSGK